MTDRQFIDKWIRVAGMYRDTKHDTDLSVERVSGMRYVLDAWLDDLAKSANINQRIWIMDNYPDIWENHRPR